MGKSAQRRTVWQLPWGEDKKITGHGKGLLDGRSRPHQGGLDDVHESDENALRRFWFLIDVEVEHRAANYSDSDQAGRGWAADRTAPLDCWRMSAVRWTGSDPLQ